MNASMEVSLKNKVYELLEAIERANNNVNSNYCELECLYNNKYDKYMVTSNRSKKDIITWCELSVLVENLEDLLKNSKYFLLYKYFDEYDGRFILPTSWYNRHHKVVDDWLINNCNWCLGYDPDIKKWCISDKGL